VYTNLWLRHRCLFLDQKILDRKGLNISLVQLSFLHYRKGFLLGYSLHQKVQLGEVLSDFS
jgi:hypothetical protein